MPISRLLYVSRCAMESQGAARDVELRALAARSVARNVEAQLTGTLLHVDDSFVQVLEGPNDAIEATFEAICRDFRHEEVKVIDFVPVKDRLFPQWSMAFLNADRETAVRIRDDLEEIRFLVGVNAREALDQMRTLLEREAV